MGRRDSIERSQGDDPQRSDSISILEGAYKIKAAKMRALSQAIVEKADIIHHTPARIKWKNCNPVRK
jgi:hypothetical protein